MTAFPGGGTTFAVIGLGNPGTEYRGTRHNMGFDAVEILARRLSASPWKKRAKGLECKARTNMGTVLLVQPQTFMNLSGQCVQEVMSYYRLQPSEVLVIYDDIDIAPGTVRVRPSGGPGTHNGMRSVVELIGEGFSRVRVGVGVGKQQHGALADYVLGRPQGEERALLDRALEAAAEAALCVMEKGTEQAMQSFNGFDAKKI